MWSVHTHGSLGDAELVKRLLEEEEIAGIVNFAAQTHVDRSIDHPLNFWDVNVMETLVFMEAVRNYFEILPPDKKALFRVLHVSTDEVFGSLSRDEAPFDEQSPLRPNNPYSASKAASEHFLRAYFHTFGFPFIITNCTNNYGPFQFPEKLIPLVISKALNQETIPIYGDGTNRRDWIYVEDHVEALIMAFQKGEIGESYCVGAGEEKSNLELVEEICEILEDLVPCEIGRYRDQISFVTDRLGHDFRYAIDASKLQSQTGWRPKFSFSNGLRRTVEWYLEKEIASRKMK